MPTTSIRGQVVDIEGRRIFGGEVVVSDGRIVEIRPIKEAGPNFILPGFIDAHVHIESSMLVPSEFARLAVVHGTVATVSDPHEIANVLGIPGVDFMINNGREVPFWFYFGAPSCVPATPFETAGAVLDPDAVDNLLKRKEIRYLAEMMNWPGVINGDESVVKKIASARKYEKSVDGHAPGLNPAQAETYIRAGIHTDHECVAFEEALHKLSFGMKVIIREGSAARNFEALVPLLKTHADMLMFCSDDKHPDSLVDGHINKLVSRAVKRGFDVFDALKTACINPVKHYGLEVGQLRVGDSADFIMVKDLSDFEVEETYVRGQKVAEKGKSLISSVPVKTSNNFQGHVIQPADFAVEAISDTMHVMVAHDGQLITTAAIRMAKVENGFAVADPDNNLLKIAVVNRYSSASPAIAFIENIGLNTGAIASSVAHDSHNIVVVGADDESMASAVNAIIREKGGVAVAEHDKTSILPLPVAGIMSDKDGYEIARSYQELDRRAKKLGARLEAPFMTLSFMALLVIPELKLSDKGLFDGVKFKLKPLFV